jgi:hypothetical protein
MKLRFEPAEVNLNKGIAGKTRIDHGYHQILLPYPLEKLRHRALTTTEHKFGDIECDIPQWLIKEFIS